jgi:hypothetical protein
MGRASRQAGDVHRAKESLDALIRKRSDLDARFQEEIDQLEDRFDPELEELMTTVLKPRKTDIDVRALSLAWLPCRRLAGGEAEPLWR